MRTVLILALLALSQCTYADGKHTSYRKSLEDLALSECGLTIKFVQSEMFTVAGGTASGEVTRVECPRGDRLTVSFSPPLTREDGTPLVPSEIRYEIEFVGRVMQRMRSCDADDLCSVWVSP